MSLWSRILQGMTAFSLDTVVRKVAAVLGTALGFRYLNLPAHGRMSIPHYVALSRGVNRADLRLAGPDGSAYVHCLDPQEVTDGGMVVFRIIVDEQEGALA